VINSKLKSSNQSLTHMGGCSERLKNTLLHITALKDRRHHFMHMETIQYIYNSLIISTFLKTNKKECINAQN